MDDETRIALEGQQQRRSSARDSTVVAHENLLAVFDALDAGVTVTDAETFELIYANAAMKDLFGDLVGRKCWEVLRGLGGLCPDCNMGKLREEDSPPSRVLIREERNPSNDRWYEVRDRLMRWVDGRLVRVSISTDITERHANQEALRASEERLRAANEAQGEGLFVIDAQGCLTYANPKAQALLGWREADLLGRKLHDIIHGHMPDGSVRAEHLCPSAQVLLSGEAIEVHDDHFQRQDGGFLPVAYAASPTLRQGVVTGLVLTFHDITSRHALVREQAQLIQQLQAALAKVKRLGGLLPICAWCKRIRNDEGYWQQVEDYLGEQTGTEFTHGVCTECAKAIHAEMDGAPTSSE